MFQSLRRLCDQTRLRGGNDDIEACIIDAEGDAEVAAYGCEDPFDAYFDCVERSAICDRSLGSDPYWGVPFDGSTGVFRCEAEVERLDTCTRPVTP